MVKTQYINVLIMDAFVASSLLLLTPCSLIAELISDRNVLFIRLLRIIEQIKNDEGQAGLKMQYCIIRFCVKAAQAADWKMERVSDILT